MCYSAQVWSDFRRYQRAYGAHIDYPLPLACLWSHWTGVAAEPDLLSFSLITDEPPPEVAAAGHDRCPVVLKESNVRAGLAPPTTTRY